MTAHQVERPMRIKLSEEWRERLLLELQGFSKEEFDRELSDYQAGRLIDFFLRRIGAPVYNQAILDARTFLQAKLDDLEGDFYEPEVSP